MRGWVRIAAALAAASLAIGAASPQPADPVIALHAGLVRLFAPPSPPSESAVQALALKVFDMPAITLAVLGDSAKRATPAQRARLSHLLVARLAHQIVLAGRQTAGDGFAVVKTQNLNATDVVVTTREQRLAVGGSPAQAEVLAWQVRREGPRFRIIDTLRDGLSTVGVEHDDFAAQLKGRDIDAVIAQMERRAAAPRPQL